MTAASDERFREFAPAALVRLRPLAHATARDAHRADDLIQTTLERMYAAWPRIERTVTDPMAYARTTLVRALISERRRHWWSREVTVEMGGADGAAERWWDPGAGPAGDPYAEAEVRLDLRAALAQLPPRQRMTVVLRYLEDLPVQEVAELMSCSTGTVKSSSSSGLASLRRILGAAMSDQMGDAT
jgi:RNA polymerase sigma factor (sigma-70 family)